MQLQQNFSNSMKTVYANRKKTLTAFSDELGISRSSLQEILKGNGNPRIDTVEHIASRLGVDPLLLLSTSCSDEDVQLLISLFRLSDVACTLSNDKKVELASHFHAIIDILIDVKE